MNRAGHRPLESPSRFNLLTAMKMVDEIAALAAEGHVMRSWRAQAELIALLDRWRRCHISRSQSVTATVCSTSIPMYQPVETSHVRLRALDSCCTHVPCKSQQAWIPGGSFGCTPGVHSLDLAGTPGHERHGFDRCRPCVSDSSHCLCESTFVIGLLQC